MNATQPILLSIPALFANRSYDLLIALQNLTHSNPRLHATLGADDGVLIKQCLDAVDAIEIAVGGENYMAGERAEHARLLHAEMREGCVSIEGGKDGVEERLGEGGKRTVGTAAWEVEGRD